MHGDAALGNRARLLPAVAATDQEATHDDAAQCDRQNHQGTGLLQARGDTGRAGKIRELRGQLYELAGHESPYARAV